MNCDRCGDPVKNGLNTAHISKTVTDLEETRLTTANFILCETCVELLLEVLDNPAIKA